MLEKSFKALQGYIFIIILLQTNVQVDGQCSEMTKVENLTYIRCHGSFTNIPNKLNKKLQSLTIEESKVTSLSVDSFKRYDKLVSLQILDTNVSLVRDNNYFIHLTHLRILDTSGSSIPNLKNALLPSSLISLNISGAMVDEFSAENLPNLTYFNASKNRLPQFPNFHINAAIEYIDLNFNPDISITAEMLMPLCRIKTLMANQYAYIKPTEDDDSYCKCMRTRFWVNKHIVTSNLKSCTWLKETFKWCFMGTDVYSMDKYRECQDNVLISQGKIPESRKRVYFTPYLFLLLFLIVLAICLYTLIFKKRSTEKDGVAVKKTESESELSSEENDEDEEKDEEAEAEDGSTKLARPSTNEGGSKKFNRPSTTGEGSTKFTRSSTGEGSTATTQSTTTAKTKITGTWVYTVN